MYGTLGGALLTLVPLAVAFMLSPIALVEMILVLFSRRSRINGIVFLGMVLVPTFLVPLVGATAYEVASDESASATSTGTGWVLLVLGCLMLLGASINWCNRGDRSAPAVFDKIQGMGPGTVAFLALGVTVMNPKNLALLFAAGRVIGSTGFTSGGMLLAAGLFMILATLPFLVVIGYRLLGGAAAEARLGHWKTWLISNNRTIMAVVLGVLGLNLAASGISVIT